jgi:hypothetical protein
MFQAFDTSQAQPTPDHDEFPLGSNAAEPDLQDAPLLPNSREIGFQDISEELLHFEHFPVAHGGFAAVHRGVIQRDGQRIPVSSLVYLLKCSILLLNVRTQVAIKIIFLSHSKADDRTSFEKVRIH